MPDEKYDFVNSLRTFLILYAYHSQVSYMNDTYVTGWQRFVILCLLFFILKLFIMIRITCVQESMDRMADMQQETKDLQVCVRSLQEKMEVINQVTFSYFFYSSDTLKKL